MNTPSTAEMPRYVCHKVVHALKIATVQAGAIAPYDVLLTPEDKRFAPLRVTQEWARKKNVGGERYHAPDGEFDPGYYVVYEDGYTSWSPTEAFEKGYTRLEDGVSL